MITEIVEVAPMRLACVHHKGPYHEIGAAFGRLGEIAGPSGLFAYPGAAMIAAYLDDPATKAAEELDSVAGVSVPNGVDIGELEEFLLPGGKYFKAVVHGPYSGLGEAWSEVCGKLIPEAGLRFAPGIPFEMYMNDCSVTPPEEVRTDIYVPIQ